MNSCSATTTSTNSKTNIEYIEASCNVTAYRRLCYRSLARRASEIKSDPKLLAHTALNTTLSAAKCTSRMMRDMSKIHSLKPKEAAAVLDCIADIHDSVEEIQKSMREFDDDDTENSDLVVQISDVQTWVNAALEDEDTCLVAFSGKALNGKVKSRVRRSIKKLAHLTSNALALINSYALVKNQSNFIN
ncbi:hypothetical protein LWI29_023083 [Acer saccharum]|uniref:Pectinesterase inhibitor domain-containing protein n=1 Tax=Acer saccharum TaxID=4024 RepID=A0AA39VQC4_ACESA|nr:hypothetical protein LWI29_023083 [Acer saccharum]